MCRLLAFADHRPCAVNQVLDPGELSRLRGLSSLHADGWGMAWFAEAPSDGSSAAARAGTYRSTSRALDDPAFAALTTEPLGSHGFVHLRWATDTYAVITDNTHPFTARGWAFAHNGSVPHPDRLETALSERSRSRLCGQSDSERYFLYLLDRLDDHDDLLEGVRAAVAGIRQRCGAASLNAVLAGPDLLMVIQGRGGALAPIEDLMATVSHVDELPPDHLDGYFRLRYRVCGTQVAVCSTGVVGESWSDLPEDSVLIAELANGSTAIHSLDPGAPPATASVATCVGSEP